MGETSENFECKTGLRQGDALSPIIFNLVLEKEIRDIQEEQEMEIIEVNTFLAYADDIVILGLFIASHNMGLLVNETKTKYMVMSRQVNQKNNIKINGYSFEQVEEFKYLGVNINEKNNMHNEIKLRMCSANIEAISYERDVLIKASIMPNEREVVHYIFGLHCNVCM